MFRTIIDWVKEKYNVYVYSNFYEIHLFMKQYPNVLWMLMFLFVGAAISLLIEFVFN